MIKLMDILLEEKQTYNLFCDLDGVLTDFESGYEKLTGNHPKNIEAEMSKENFWEPISKAGASFWIRLRWMPDGKALWEYIKKYTPTILSAPSRDESSKMGKRIWKKRELPDAKMILIPAEQKKKYASPNSILIDDRAKNINEWEAAGGIGIHHLSTLETIKHLKQIGL